MVTPSVEVCKLCCNTFSSRQAQRANLHPYVLQVGSRGIEAAWAGGSRGREVTDRLLPVVAQLLSTDGSFYLITIAENDPGEFTDVRDVLRCRQTS